MTFHNSALARLVPDGNYRADDLARVEAARFQRRPRNQRHAPFQGWRRSAVASLRSDRVRVLRASLSRDELSRGSREQVFHFNRSLAQITDDWRCAELYHLRQSEYVANPHAPLQWTQAHRGDRGIASHACARRALIAEVPTPLLSFLSFVRLVGSTTATQALYAVSDLATTR